MPLERELLSLIRKTAERTTELAPPDLDSLRDLVGAATLDYVHVIETYHYYNRVAGMLGVASEMIPRTLRRFGFLRTGAVRLAAYVMKRGDHSIRDYEVSFEQALNDIRPVFVRATGKEPKTELEPLRNRPKLVESMRMHLEERDTRSSLDRDTMARIHSTVEAALEERTDGRSGSFDHPRDPVEELAYVGTLFAYRTTAGMIDTLRREGYDDLGILDLAIAVADAAKWAITHRLLDLDPGLLYCGTGVRERA